MTTYAFRDFIPKLIEQDQRFFTELALMLDEAGDDLEIRIRDDLGVVYILGLLNDEKGLRGELRRMKHQRHVFEPVEGFFPLNASLAGVLVAKHDESHTLILEEEAYRDNLDF